MHVSRGTRLCRASVAALLWGGVLSLATPSLASETGPEAYLRLLTELRAHQKDFDWPAVVSLLERAVELNPTEPRHWWDLGVARARIEQYRTAIEAFRRADALGGGFDWDPVFVTVRGEALYQIACCQAQLGEQDAALSTLDQAMAAGLRRPKRLLTESKLESLRDHPRLREMAGAIDTSQLSRDEGYRTDLKFLTREMFRLHFNPYHVHDRATFDAAIQSLDAEIPQLSESQILVRFQQLIALLGDGHSGLRLRNARVLPVRFYWFAEGVFISGVKQGNERLLGAQVLAVNDHATEEVLKAFEPIVAHDNEMNIRASTPRMWRVTDFHVGLGLASDNRATALTLRLPNGSQETVQLASEPYRERQAETESWIDAPAGDSPLPLSWQHRDTMLWFEPTADGRVLYASINGLGNPRGETFKAFTARLFQYADEHPEIRRLVLDFRRNGGGDTFLNRPLIQALARSRFNQPGSLVVLIGRETFSAAQNTITEIERHTEAIFVGEPSGSRPNFIGESVAFTLPYSNSGVSISDLYWVTSSPLDRRMWIAPPDLLAAARVRFPRQARSRAGRSHRKCVGCCHDR